MANIEKGSFENMLHRLCDYSLNSIKEAENEEEFAYALGIFETATSLYGAVMQSSKTNEDAICVSITGDYQEAKATFAKWLASRCPHYHKQLALDKIFKDVFAGIDETPKSTKTKSKPKNEEA